MKVKKAKGFFVAAVCLMLAFAGSCGEQLPSSGSGSDPLPPATSSSDSVSGGNSSAPDETPGVPTVTPAAATADVGGDTADLTFTVGYNKGTFSKLLSDGREVESSAYERQASRLILKGGYLKTLTSGVHEFTLVKDGGEAKFTVTVNFSGINFTDTQRVKKYSVSNVSFSVDLGGNQPARVTVAGAEVGAEAWTYADGALTFKKAYLEPLSDGVYDIRIFDNGGKYENCVVVKGMEPADLLRFDADAFSHETNGFGQDLKISTEANGIDGASLRVENAKSGTLLNIGAGNVAYNFKTGITYALSFEMEIESITAGTSSVSDLLMPIYFVTAAGGKGDIGFIRYNETDGLYFTAENKCLAYSLEEIGGAVRFCAEFAYDGSYASFELPVWMKSTFLIDNLQIAPKTGSMTILAETEKNVPLGYDADMVFDFGDVSVLGASLGGAALSSEGWSAQEGIFTLKGGFIASLAAGSKNVLTVYTSHGRQNVTINVNKYNLSVNGEAFNYALDGKDLEFTVTASGFDLKSAKVSDSKGVLSAADYEVSGDKLTLKSTYLEKIVLSERIELEFSAEAKLGFAVTSNKVFLVDFDGRGVPEKGFGIGFATKETAGKDGNGYNLVNTGTASFLTLGGVFYPLTFEAGVSYTFEFDLEINDIDFTNFVIAGNSCFMPVTFGSGKDVTYIRLSDDGKGGVMVANETQQLGTASNVPAKGEDGFYHISFSFVPTADCTTLTFDVWMACDITVDNLTLVKN